MQTFLMILLATGIGWLLLFFTGLTGPLFTGLLAFGIIVGLQLRIISLLKEWMGLRVRPEDKAKMARDEYTRERDGLDR
ncbi:hypothetical protein [Indiicoccus explosivorum]|uniref:hypothetical protein n=1 Tax=Indiicoccus explosivorum TaxID=1917864 RepID=UPI000B44685B|nr:hypothetical protein [Indiicoccus explosivorum]